MKTRKAIALIAILAIFAAACGTAEEVVEEETVIDPFFQPKYKK